MHATIRRDLGAVSSIWTASVISRSRARVRWSAGRVIDTAWPRWGDASGAAVRYFEDLQPGDVASGPTFVVERDELVEFARRWDPQPFHLDDAVANEMFGEGGVTAPGVFVMAIRTRLLHDTPDLAVIAALGYDELRFHAPVRAGDILQLRQKWLDKRVSDSKPDRGVARSRLSLVNQDGVEVMSHIDTILLRRRNPND